MRSHLPAKKIDRDTDVLSRILDGLTVTRQLQDSRASKSGPADDFNGRHRLQSVRLIS